MGQPEDDVVGEIEVSPETEDVSVEKETDLTLASQIDSTSKSYVHQSQSLCEGEREFVLRRKQVALKSLKKLGVKCKPDSVPHIALLGSAGGHKAVVSFLGSLHQLQEEGLLDAMLYLGGVAASAWTMSSLYLDPQWTTHMDVAVSTLTDPVSGLTEALSWMGDEAKEKHSFLSEIWGDLTSGSIMKKLDHLPLPGDSMNVNNPYPLYSAVNRDCLRYGPEKAKWFEISPHEAGFTDLGLYVDTAHLRSTMQKEEGTKKNDRGIFIPNWLQDKLNINPFRKTNEEQSILTEWHQKLLASLENLDKEPLKSQVSWLIKKAFGLIEKLDWGTIKNFLYEYSDDEVPPCITHKKNLQLMDAGVMLNLSFPSFLGEKRDVDLFIALDFGADGTFKTLTLARDYAAELKKPFPKIDDVILKDSEWPKDLYIFAGKVKEPTIIYMPIFNKENCEDLEQYQTRIKAFSTFDLSFSKDKFEFLLETAKNNIKRNKKILRKEIKKAAVRREKYKRVK
ncbi:cytosolic phospholipase A2 gamma-like [Mugil cephalus]|uniref:cytosolic phospholipase A2 gamma-like n=1 Tax=Mugil cephalus TaxID=48193 RepID=UPI001FB657C3|nr:cytosolic phospholipase A2 gamma-like [Mugil cephalus]